MNKPKNPALFFGAIAVAVAIAFGLGGRDTASQLLRDWRGQIEEKTSSDGSSGARTAMGASRGAGSGGGAGAAE